MKAYQDNADYANKYNLGPTHYQELSADWHNFVEEHSVSEWQEDTRNAAVLASVSRYKMGLREADYEWESHAG